MEEEPFNNIEIATRINTHFVAIKLDREERPDLDTLYQTAASMLGSQNGWPLNLFLTPQKKPFAAFTYIPPSTRSGLMVLIA